MLISYFSTLAHESKEGKALLRGEEATTTAVLPEYRHQTHAALREAVLQHNALREEMRRLDGEERWWQEPADDERLVVSITVDKDARAGITKAPMVFTGLRVRDLFTENAR